MDSPLYTLASDGLHVWRVDLDCPASTVDQLRRSLSLDEKIRADQFHFAVHQNRFVVARASLRTILAGYVAAHPQEIAFSYGAQGKPALTNSSEAAINLNFNLAHSGTLAVVAVGRGTQIGIDVEEIRPEFAQTRIAEDFFSRNEIEQLRSLPADKQLQAFFTCWTRKEAFLKAKGVGLSQALDQFSVSVDPDAEARLLETAWDSSEVSRWFLESIDVGSAFAAALAFEGSARTICMRELERG